jgi:predicted nucleotidyltransferase
VAAPAVDVLARMRTELFNRIRRAVGAWELAPVHVSIFGSTARGDGGTDSDVDLFVVRSSSVRRESARWRAQLEDIARQVQRWTGNHAGVAEVSEDELARLRVTVQVPAFSSVQWPSGGMQQ